MADPTKDNDHSSGADEQGSEGSAGADEFADGFAEDEDEESGSSGAGGGGSGDEEEEEEEEEPGADEKPAAGDDKDPPPKKDDDQGEEKGEKQKALEERVKQRADAEQAQKEDDFWKQVEAGFDGDVDKVTGSKEFAAWIEKQPEAVQQAAGQVDDPAAALKVLNDYQAFTESESKVDTDVAAFLAKSGLADIEIGATEEGETPTKLSEFVEEYPEIGQAMLAITGALVKQGIQAAIADAGYMTPDQVQALIAGQSKVASLHNDAKDVVESQGYKDWLQTQPAGVQAMAKSADADDQVYVISAYKEHAAAKETPAQKAAREKLAAAHKKKQAVHSASVEDGVGSGGGGGDPAAGADDFAAGWAEEDENDV